MKVTMAQGALLLVLSTSAFAQKPGGPAPAQGVRLTDPVVKINGKVLTRGEIEDLVDAIPERFQAFYKTNPREFMSMLSFIELLAKRAVERKIPELPPYKQKLEFNRTFALHEYLQEFQQNSYRVTDAEVKQAYDKTLDRYTTAKVRLIYISFVTPPAAGTSESEAKAKIEKLHAGLGAGDDFAKLARENSEVFKERDGELGSVTKADALPDAVKSVIFSLKKGEYSQPVRHDNGYYLFKIDDREVKPLDQVKEEISVELRGQMFRNWLEEQKKDARTEILREEFFKPSIPVPAAPVAPPK